MEGFIPDSFCGLFCGACDIMHAYRSNGEQGREARWEDLPAPLRENIAKAEVKCHGCRSDTVFAGCRGCRIRQCAREKSVTACVECKDFPCATVGDMTSRLPSLQHKLPHTRDIFGDCETAKEIGLESWRKKQRSRWRCSSCGALFTWYQERCGTCGLELKTIRGY
jgi:hypothetical protein